MRRKNRERRAGTCGVADAQFVKDIRVGSRQVGDRVFAEKQPLEHRLVDDASRLLRVRPYRIHSDRFDSRPDALFVDRVEIDVGPASRVRLRTKRHENEAERFQSAVQVIFQTRTNARLTKTGRR